MNNDKYLLTIIHDLSVPGSRSHGVDQFGKSWTRFIAPSNPPKCSICGKEIDRGWTEEEKPFVVDACDEHFQITIKEAQDAQ